MSRKVTNLVELARHGIKVPIGFGLGDHHFHQAIAPVREKLISAVLNRTGIPEIFGNLDLPVITREVLGRELDKFSASAVFAVRSSGNVMCQGQHILEDGTEVSLAGQFESYLNVSRDQVPFAVVQCWSSLFNDRSLEAFRADASYVTGSAMTVLIQEMIVAKASAVVMTVDPLENGELGGIELTFGPCEAIVSGAVSPDEVSFRRRDGAIVARRVGSKEFIVEYKRFSRGRDNIVLTPTGVEICAQMAVTDAVLDGIIENARRIEKLFGHPQDIELVIDHADEITIVQSRPITRLPNQIAAFGDIPVRP